MDIGKAIVWIVIFIVVALILNHFGLMDLSNLFQLNPSGSTSSLGSGAGGCIGC